jgi:peptide/nickel transport system permease protein
MIAIQQQAMSPSKEAWRVFKRNKAAILGISILLGLILMMLVGPSLYGINPTELVADPFIAPFEQRKVWLGTDYLGRDILAGILVGGRATVLVGLTAALLSVTIGITMGALAGYFGGWVDTVLSRVVELFQVLPALLFAMVLVTLFTPKISIVVVAISLVSWTGTARLARAEFMRLKGLEYVSAAKAQGASHLRLMLSEILPNALPPLIVSATLIIGSAILFEGGLAFLGLSDPNITSWGNMIGNNRRHILEAWWVVTFPGVGIFLTVLSMSLVGDGLNDALNPRLHLR